jgi:two-component system, NarL family, invasion response regulator UvrY
MNAITVSLVDDHVVLRNGLAAIVNNIENFKVISQSNNGREFINTITKNKLLPDIVLLDVSMPQMNGFETAEWISKNLQRTKILVLSMFDDEKSIIRMIRNGAKGYILKDCEPNELETALENIVQKGYHYTDLVNAKFIYASKKDENGETKEKETHITSKEMDFLKLACSEMSYKEIADILCLSVRTVEGYRDTLFTKLDLKTRVGLVLYCLKNNIVKV